MCALHSIDRSSSDRGTPAPNYHDASYISGGAPIINVPRAAHKTASVNYVSSVTNASTQSGTFNGYKILVQKGTMTVNGSGTTIVTTLAHNLGYAPLVEGAINNASVSNISGKVNIPLPTWLNVNLAGANILLSVWGSMMVDATNVYVYTLNTTGSNVSYTVTYYLYQQQAQ